MAKQSPFMVACLETETQSLNVQESWKRSIDWGKLMEN
jgi:hypothetical protein